MNVAVIQFPGSNCDDDTRYVVDTIPGGKARLVWHRETDLRDADAVIIPGGFSYGDYLRTGSMAAVSPIMNSVKTFAERGGPVLGICNGFQILTETGLLPGALGRNPVLHFRCLNVSLKVERTDTPFTAEYENDQVLSIPVAHNEGSYYADPQTIERLEGEGQVVFRYCTPEGQVNESANPNGSINNIAGITNARGNVLGMMPHPERAAEALLGSEDGLPLFRSLAAWLEHNRVR
jgi:phosphoribosylformylglycinamidine synthase I